MEKQIQAQRDTKAIVRRAYLRLMPVQVFGIAVTAINGFIDSVITSRFLGTEALAAIGFFGPIGMIIGITWVLTTGVQILCSHYIGAGDKKGVVSTFSACVVLLSCFSLAFTAVCLIGHGALSAAAGARGETARLLSPYILGYAPGIIGQVLSGVLMVFLPFNNDTKRSYAGIGVMLVVNVGMDLLNALVLHWGTFGMGLATSISYLASSAVMIISFFGSGKAIHLSLKSLNLREMPKAILLGLPSLMFTIGLTLKGFLLNVRLFTMVGASAVAVMNVQNNVISIIGAIPQGCAAALLTLASLYYGDKDRESMVFATRDSLKYGLILSSASVAVLMACSSVIPAMFFRHTDPAYALAQRMLLLFPNWLVLNLLFGVFTKIYQCQDRKVLVNVLSFAETLGPAAVSVVLAPVMGVDGVWISFSVCEIICLIVIAITVFIHSKKITFSLEDWMQLKPDFGTPPDMCMEFSVHSIDDVVTKAASVMDFCSSRGIDMRHSRLARLAIEELTGNIVEHGFNDGKKHSVDVRIVAADEPLTIRIRDDCPAFDPAKYMEQFSHEDPSKNAGLRLIAGIAKSINYQNNAGINTLLINV